MILINKLLDLTLVKIWNQTFKITLNFMLLQGGPEDLFSSVIFYCYFALVLVQFVVCLFADTEALASEKHHLSEMGHEDEKLPLLRGDGTGKRHKVKVNISIYKPCFKCEIKSNISGGKL